MIGADGPVSSSAALRNSAVMLGFRSKHVKRVFADHWLANRLIVLVRCSPQARLMTRNWAFRF